MGGQPYEELECVNRSGEEKRPRWKNHHTRGAKWLQISCSPGSLPLAYDRRAGKIGG